MSKETRDKFYKEAKTCSFFKNRPLLRRKILGLFRYIKILESTIAKNNQ